MNTAILLAAYGSRHGGARAAIEAIRERVRAAHPGIPCEVAYTSDSVRDSLNREGAGARSVAEALEELRAAGADRVAVQSLHMVPGEEYSGILEAVEAFRRTPEAPRVAVGAPLMAGPEDVERVAAILAAQAPSHGGPEAVLFMGHGTPHPGNAFYGLLSEALSRRDPNLLLGCLEAAPCIEDLRDRLLERGVRGVLLVPFLFGAGHHAVQDLCGQGEGSWSSVLHRAGIACQSELKGAGEHPDLVDVWMDHLAAALRELGR